ncbi:MAG: ExbD/TolR family protein [Gammaproteobacteria bacterium]
MNSRRWRRRHNTDVAELNITAFMNLMVILVPFLLITAVFSRLTILELSLPAPGDGAADTDTPALQLEVVLRQSGVEVADTKTGLLKVLPKAADQENYDLKGLSDYLKQVKANYPDITTATILLEPEIDYNSLVQVMDTVRVYSAPGLIMTPAELFPDISIGDAVAAPLAAPVASNLSGGQ